MAIVFMAVVNKLMKSWFQVHLISCQVPYLPNMPTFVRTSSRAIHITLLTKILGIQSLPIALLLSGTHVTRHHDPQSLLHAASWDTAELVQYIHQELSTTVLV